LEPRGGKWENPGMHPAEIAGLGDFSRELVPGQMGVRKIPEEGRDFAEWTCLLKHGRTLFGQREATRHIL